MSILKQLMWCAITLIFLFNIFLFFVIKEDYKGEDMHIWKIKNIDRTQKFDMVCLTLGFPAMAIWNILIYRYERKNNKKYKQRKTKI